MQEIELRTGAWYNDRSIQLTFPDSWDVVTYWPDTPPPLTDEEIAEHIRRPIGQAPLSDLARGKKRPVIVVDDLARPTPVFKVLPFLLKEFEAAGIQPHDIRILVATGTHGHQDASALASKIGQPAYARCQVIVHSDLRGAKLIGTTSFGTPVYVNGELCTADLIVGIGGVYPQHTTGFGGGGKLMLGVSGRKTIRTLHFRHKGVGGSYNIDNDFRKDVTEIARMAGLNTIYTVHINDRMEVVQLLAGDHYAYYPQAAEFSKTRYTAPLPEDADVVIVNSYPSDVSYTFVRKAMKPIRCAPRSAMKIVIGSMHEGLGHHGLFQQGLSERIREYRELYNRISVMSPGVILQKLIKNLFFRNHRQTQSHATVSASPQVDPMWVYRPEGPGAAMEELEGVRIVRSWDAVLKGIQARYATGTSVKVRIYPCGSLQCLDAPLGQDQGSGD
jgi:nickel-dependent lactate racemase